MRTCLRCQAEMKEGFDIQIESDMHGLNLMTSQKFFAKKIERSKVAVCPKCGELSFYIAQTDKFART